MPDTSKRIIIEFDGDLIGDVTGNQNAFTVTGKQYEHVKGKLIDKVYTVTGTKRPQIIMTAPIPTFSDFDNTVFSASKIVLTEQTSS